MFKRFPLFAGALTLLIIVLVACGGNISTSTTPSIQGKTATTEKCDPAIMVNIVNDTFDKKSVNLNMGDTLLVMNQTKNTYTLTTTPDFGLHYMVVDPMEMEHVPFNKAGTFTLSSKEHPETTLQVVVSPTQSYTCGERPVATISFRANDTFSQTTVTIAKQQSIMIDNNSGKMLTINSNPSVGMGMGELLFHPGERQTVLFSNDGTYVFIVKEYPTQKLTVVVKGSSGNT